MKVSPLIRRDLPGRTQAYIRHVQGPEGGDAGACEGAALPLPGLGPRMH